MKIPFNKPEIIGNEIKYIRDAYKSGKISGDGFFTEKVNKDQILDNQCMETFVPNIKDDAPKQDDALKDFISSNLKRGQFVKDVEWEPGFFLKTFPHLFICKN